MKLFIFVAVLTFIFLKNRSNERISLFSLLAFFSKEGKRFHCYARRKMKARTATRERVHSLLRFIAVFILLAFIH